MIEKKSINSENKNEKEIKNEENLQIKEEKDKKENENTIDNENLKKEKREGININVENNLDKEKIIKLSTAEAEKDNNGKNDEDINNEIPNQPISKKNL